MTVDELNQSILALRAQRDAQLTTLRAQSAAAEAAQATAGDEVNPEIAAAQATYDAARTLDDSSEDLRDAALAQAAADIPLIGPISPAPPDQTGNIGDIGS